MVERYTQIHGGKQIKPRTVDKSRLDATGETTSYVLKVQPDGSLDYEAISTADIIDFNISSPNNGDRLFYDEATSKWVNKKMIYDSDYRAYLLEQ